MPTLISRILPLLVLLLTSTLTIIITILYSTPVLFVGVIKSLLPFSLFHRYISSFTDMMMWCWNQIISIMMKCDPGLKWDVEGLDNLSKKNWYLLISNHRSWTDIVVLCVLFRNHIPMNKFFLKQQLIWIPFIGLACWALDMPFMKRYSHNYLVKHPELRGKDIETTRHSCEKFRLRPTTIINFVEGSRCTDEKIINTNSPYRNLLPPKSAGIACTLSVLGEQFDRLLNVTLLYPDNPQHPFLDLMCGKMKRIVVRVETLPITAEMRGDYSNDKIFKRQFKLWLNDLWQKKDNLINELNKQYSSR